MLTITNIKAVQIFGVYWAMFHRILHSFLIWLGGKAAGGLERILYRELVKELQESIDRYTCRRDITVILLKTALNKSFQDKLLWIG